MSLPSILVADGDASGDLDASALGYLVAWQFAPNGRCLFSQMTRADAIPSVLEIFQQKAGPRTSEREYCNSLLDCLSSELASLVSAQLEPVILLSGGLDSRLALLVALTLGLHPRCIAWGYEGSSDRAIARSICEQLDLELVEIELDARSLQQAVVDAGTLMGATISPLHLHGYRHALSTLAPQEILVGTTYGNTMWRGEMVGRSIADLRPPHLVDWLGILSGRKKQDVMLAASSVLKREIERLKVLDGDWLEAWYLANYNVGQLVYAASTSRLGRMYQLFSRAGTAALMLSNRHFTNDETAHKILRRLSSDRLSAGFASRSPREASSGSSFHRYREDIALYLREFGLGHAARLMVSPVSMYLDLARIAVLFDRGSQGIAVGPEAVTIGWLCTLAAALSRNHADEFEPPEPPEGHPGRLRWIT